MDGTFSQTWMTQKAQCFLAKEWFLVLTTFKCISPRYPLEGLMLKLKLQYSGHLMLRADSLEKTPMLGVGGWGQEKGMTEDEMAGWHHRLNGHEFE